MIDKSYQYPLDLTWESEEIAIVIAFFNQVEKFYESKVYREVFLSTYQDFKKVVPSKSAEKKLDAAFLRVSTYSSYKALKAVEASNQIFVKSDGIV